MDPISGLSLAASVITITQCGIDITSKCSQLYRDGSLAAHADLETTTTLFSKVTKDLQNASHRAYPNGRLSQEEQQLKDLAGQCEEAADALLVELRKLQVSRNDKHRGLRSLGKAVKATWKRRDILGLQERFESYRNILESSLLADLRYSVPFLLPVMYTTFELILILAL